MPAVSSPVSCLCSQTVPLSIVTCSPLVCPSGQVLLVPLFYWVTPNGACLRAGSLKEAFGSLLIIYPLAGFIAKPQKYRTCPFGGLLGFFCFHNIFSPIFTRRKIDGTVCCPGHLLWSFVFWVLQSAGERRFRQGYSPPLRAVRRGREPPLPAPLGNP